MDNAAKPVIGARRPAILKALKAALGLARTRENVREISHAVLALDAWDFCFHDLLLLDEHACVGDESGWPFQDLLLGRRGVRLQLDLAPAIPGPGLAEQSVREAIILVVGGAERSTPAGLMIFGLSPHAPPDVDIMSFCLLVAELIGDALELLTALADEDVDLPQGLEGLAYRYCGPTNGDPGGFRWVQIN